MQSNGVQKCSLCLTFKIGKLKASKSGSLMREIMLVKTRQVRRHEYVNNKGENRHSIKFSSGGEQFTLVFQNEAERDLWYWSMLACKQMTQKE
jgi:hypothetical protein